LPVRIQQHNKNCKYEHSEPRHVHRALPGRFSRGANQYSLASRTQMFRSKPNVANRGPDNFLRISQPLPSAYFIRSGTYVGSSLCRWCRRKGASPLSRLWRGAAEAACDVVDVRSRSSCGNSSFSGENVRMSRLRPTTSRTLKQPRRWGEYTVCTKRVNSIVNI